MNSRRHDDVEKSEESSEIKDQQTICSLCSLGTMVTESLFGRRYPRHPEQADFCRTVHGFQERPEREFSGQTKSFSRSISTSHESTGRLCSSYRISLSELSADLERKTAPHSGALEPESIHSGKTSSGQVHENISQINSEEPIQARDEKNNLTEAELIDAS